MFRECIEKTLDSIGVVLGESLQQTLDAGVCGAASPLQAAVFKNDSDVQSIETASILDNHENAASGEPPSQP
jgi:hypothetical protein